MEFERKDLIEGLRNAADFFENNPKIPIPVTLNVSGTIEELINEIQWEKGQEREDGRGKTKNKNSDEHLQRVLTGVSRV